MSGSKIAFPVISSMCRQGIDSRVASKLEGQTVQIATSSIDKPDAPKPEATPTGEQPAKAKSRTKQKAASSSQSFNPFAAIFGN